MMMGQDENPFQAPFEESQGEISLTAPLLPAAQESAATQGASLNHVVQYALVWTVGPSLFDVADPLPCTVLILVYTKADWIARFSC